MTPRVQNLLIILGIVLIAGVGFYMYTLNQDATLSVASVNTQAAAESAVFVKRLETLKTVNFSDTLFSDPAFVSLIDYSEPINPTAIGKTNPFIGF